MYKVDNSKHRDFLGVTSYVLENYVNRVKGTYSQPNLNHTGTSGEESEKPANRKKQVPNMGEPEPPMLWTKEVAAGLGNVDALSLVKGGGGEYPEGPSNKYHEIVRGIK